MSPTDWIGVIVAALALIVSGLTLSRSLRNDLRQDAKTQGATDALIQDIRARLDLTDGVADAARGLRQDVDGLKDLTSQTAVTLQNHLLKCERASGRMEESQQQIKSAVERLDRSVISLQRMVGNMAAKGHGAD